MGDRALLDGFLLVVRDSEGHLLSDSRLQKAGERAAALQRHSEQRRLHGENLPLGTLIQWESGSAPVKQAKGQLQQASQIYLNGCGMAALPRALYCQEPALKQPGRSGESRG